jgi:transcriptional regulator with XRE-family HTH domain
MEELRIGGVVRRLREAQALTLRALAERSGFTASFLSQLENDQTSPSISSMERIAGALGVTLGEFFSDAEREHVTRVVRAGARNVLYSNGPVPTSSPSPLASRTVKCSRCSSL